MLLVEMQSKTLYYAKSRYLSSSV